MSVLQAVGFNDCNMFYYVLERFQLCYAECQSTFLGVGLELFHVVRFQSGVDSGAYNHPNIKPHCVEQETD